MSKYKKAVEVSIPEAHDLGFCTVNALSEFPFTVFNPNAKPLNYIFKFTEFMISPSKGVLLPNSYANFRIEFKPTQAAVIVGSIVLQVQGEEQRIFKLSAVGKYPYISILNSDIDFGNVLVTKTAVKDLLIKNSSQVPARFFISKNSQNTDYNDNFYEFAPERGEIPAKMSFNVKIQYTPLFVNTKTINNFKMICESGNDVNLNIRGDSNSFNVYFNTSSINFGQIKLDCTLNKVLTITNDSEAETEFEFFTDPNNIFSFNEIRGTLPRNSYKKIIIEFRPRNTISYYERVYCLIRNHILLFVDLIGTCYDLLIRPIPLQQVHVDIFRKRVIQGRISAIELKYIENNILLKLAKKVAAESEENTGTVEQNFYQTNSLIKEDPYILHKQLFLSNESNQLIAISQDNIEFGFCEIMTLSGQREVEITNKMQCKLNLFWITQKKETFTGEYMTVFQVYPESATLKPNVPTKFTITFRPLKSNNYYFQHLQFYAVKHNSKITKKTLEEFEYKELKAKPETTLLRNVKLSQTIQSKVKEDIDSTEVFPPIGGVVRCVGHSFNLSSMPFLPIMKIFPSNKITFKPCLINYSVYDSIQLVNQSDTPIYFKIGLDAQRAFKAFPRIGLIQAKSFCIVALEFSPREYKLYKSTLSVTLNDMPGAGSKLNLIGVCTQPNIKLENEGKLYFAPTFTGVCTKKQFVIENLSKTRVTYRIHVPQKYENELSFDPKQKVLEANERFTLNAFFVPHFKRSYKILVPIDAIEENVATNLSVGYHNPGSGGFKLGQDEDIPNREQKQFVLQVFGQGSDGSIKISHEEIDFKTVKITEQKKLNFSLKNTSNCSFYVDLQLKNNQFDEPFQPSAEAQIGSVFHLDFKEGILPANSEITVGLFFSPTDVQKYDLKLIISAKEKVQKASTFKNKGTQPCMKCEMRVRAEGNYPLMEIIDIRNDTLSVAALWENFQISKINNELNCKLDSSEKKYLAVENLTFSQAKTLQSKLKHYEWNLGYVSTKSKAKPRKVIITVKNFGGTPLDYTFKFPSDNKVEEQLWADPGEPTEEEAYQKAILQNNIFQIRPKVARLQPNEVKDIELIYSPVSLQNLKINGSSNQIHFLKVVFQIQNGKSLVFNLKGTTLGPNEGLLTVKKSHYILPETPIGLMEPLRFPIEINNVGSIKVNYKTEIKYEENEFPQVFRVENPNHFLLSGENHYIYCLYKPLIKKKYNFTILIHVYDFNKEIQVIELKIEGNGIKGVGHVAKNAPTKAIPGQRTMVSEIGSKVFFSIEEIDFEAMQAEQIKYKMIILYNMSKENSLNFDFPTQSNINSSKLGLTCGDKFTIQPCQGTLEANKFIELKITLAAGSNPSFYEGETPCHIVWAQTKYSEGDNDLTQKDVILTSQKESLFLRIKKSSLLNTKNVSPKSPKLQMEDNKKSVIDHIFQSIISNSLNESNLTDLIEKLQTEVNPLIDMLDENIPVSIGQKQKQIKEDAYEDKKDYSNHQYLLLSEQFKEITEIVMENTFFNIVQETTHQANDFLRVGKKFIPANKL